MYKQCFRKLLEVRTSFPSKLRFEASRERIQEFLTRQGFEKLSEKTDAIVAQRGRKFCSLFNIGDPRRVFHVIEVANQTGALTIRFSISTWFGLVTKDDIAVFTTESDMLRRYVEDGHFDDTQLKDAQARRKKSDLRTFGLLIVIAAVIGVVVVILLL